MNLSDLPGLQIDSPLTKTDMPNFRPTSWPPTDDFPVIIDTQGNVISRYGDVRWDLSPWSGQTLTMYFGDGPGKGKKISSENAALLRKIVAWWLWGTSAVTRAKTLVFRFETIKPLFVACTDQNIIASELYRFPEVIKGISSYYTSRKNYLMSYLNDLSYVGDTLGFNILDENGMKLLSEILPNPEQIQTAYIPVRIWSYQVSRLRECLDEFMLHKDNIEACYEFCQDAYRINAGGSLSNAFSGLGGNTPFNKAKIPGEKKSGLVFHGPFYETAKRYEIDELLYKWVDIKKQFGVRSLSSYMSLISAAGLAYILNFSLMRIQEGSRLRVKCYEVERDSIGEDIHMLKGVTTKTIEDNDARWIISSTVKVAIDAMTIIANLRLKSAKENPSLQLLEENISNPLLQTFPHEPWSSRQPSLQSANLFKKTRTYADIWNQWPKLFSTEEMKITDLDWEMANRLTSGLDPERFSVGRVWPLAWHQLRRTGAVNMLASGLVTESSLQYQLKHASRAMSQYYGKNYYRLKEPLSDETRGFYLREMYQSMVREFKSLQSEHYISPHSEKRKEQLLSEISEKDHSQLISAAKAGRISYRQTFLGGCANSGPPCPLGGISNISSCMGFGNEKPCNSALIDIKKLPVIKQLIGLISIQLEGVEASSPLHKSLNAQLESAERAIDVIQKS